MYLTHVQNGLIVYNHSLIVLGPSFIWQRTRVSQNLSLFFERKKEKNIIHILFILMIIYLFGSLFITWVWFKKKLNDGVVFFCYFLF